MPMNIAVALVNELKLLGLDICTVESCTGGALASAITDVPGASEVFEQGFVAYSNQAKEILDLYLERENCISRTIGDHGVYSPETAARMAEMGAELAQIGVGITGTLTREDPANTEGASGKATWRYVSVVTKPSRKKSSQGTGTVPKERKSS